MCCFQGKRVWGFEKTDFNSRDGDKQKRVWKQVFRLQLLKDEAIERGSLIVLGVPRVLKPSTKINEKRHLQ